MDHILWWSMGLHRGCTAAIITSPLGVKMKYAARLEFQCTNNIVEYEAVLLGLRKARAM